MMCQCATRNICRAACSVRVSGGWTGNGLGLANQGWRMCAKGSLGPGQLLAGSDRATSLSRCPTLTSQPREPHQLLVSCLTASPAPSPRAERVWISAVPAIISLAPISMLSSPPSAPGTPRTASPLPADDEHTRLVSPSPDDAHTTATLREAHAMAVAPSATGAVSAHPDGESVTEPKGKEKAARGPLRFLDLPVDILKEIIHQVSASTKSNASFPP